MGYKLKKVELLFDQNGTLERVLSTAEMPGNPKDVRTIGAAKKNTYWHFDFIKLDAIMPTLQKITGHGSEV